MNKSALLIAPLLAAFAVSPAFAERGGKHGHKDKAKGHDRHEVDHRRGDRDRVVLVDRDGRRPTVVVRNRDGHDRFDGRHDNGLHLGWYKNHWKRGDRIDWQYVQPTYYVTDYGRYDLRPAPVGYRWVRPMDDRYLLVEIATGLIVDALGY